MPAKISGRYQRSQQQEKSRQMLVQHPITSCLLEKKSVCNSEREYVAIDQIQTCPQQVGQINWSYTRYKIHLPGTSTTIEGTRWKLNLFVVEDHPLPRKRNSGDLFTDSEKQHAKIFLFYRIPGSPDWRPQNIQIRQICHSSDKGKYYSFRTFILDLSTSS